MALWQLVGMDLKIGNYHEEMISEYINGTSMQCKETEREERYFKLQRSRAKNKPENKC